MTGRCHARFVGTSVALGLLVVVVGCAGVRTRSPPIPVEEESVETGEFTVAENMLDTWNTIGKILVALEGVAYEGRAQMLGLYAVRYRGEQFLIRTQAVTISDVSRGISTRVGALGPAGQPFHHPAAVALLKILAQRVPQEVAQYRQPVELPDAAAKKRRKKR